MKIQSWGIDRDSCCLEIQTKTFTNTEFIITLPRELIDAKVGHQDSEFFVLIDEEEIDFTESTTTTERILKFSCPKQTERIEIIGNQICGIFYGVSDGEEYEVKILKGASSPNNKNFYDYPHIQIHRGDSVTWINQDVSAHTITSGTSNEGPDGLFYSSVFLSDTIFSITFEKTGIFTYFDMVNPWMVGSVIVDE